MTFELIMDSKNIYIKSNHNILTAAAWTSKVKPSTMKACPRKCLNFIDRKSLKRVHFGAVGLSLSVHFLLAPRLFLIRTPHQLNLLSLSPSMIQASLTKDSVKSKCTLRVEINCLSCRELKGSLALPSIYCVLGATTCKF